MARTLFPRFLEAKISEALENTRVTTITGPRQSGKTTLAHKFTSDTRQFYTLDDSPTYDAADSDPVGFISRIEHGSIDEIQRAPKLIRAIKISVDSDPRPGRFLLTGSANILTIPKIPESLAGRMWIKTLLPLSQAEIEGTQVSFLDDLFEAEDMPFRKTGYKVEDLELRVLHGGYPGMLQASSDSIRREWATNYVNSIISRDIKELLRAYQLKDLSKLLQACAIQSSQMVVHSKVGKHMALDVKTVQRYLDTLEQLYLIEYLPAWRTGELRRLVSTPKLHFLDTGLLSAIRKIDQRVIEENRGVFGPLLESFVFAELKKIATWSKEQHSFHYYRDKDKAEVDFVISSGFNALAGIEVKASATVQSKDFAGLKKLQAAAGSSFKVGVLLYTGERVLPFGDRLFAAPVSVLWS